MSSQRLQKVLAQAGIASRRAAERLITEGRVRVNGRIVTELGARVETGTVFANRCDYLDPALVWTGVKDTGKGGALSEIGYANLTQPKSYHLKVV